MTRRPIVIVALAAAVLFAWAGAQATSALQASPTAVAVVDIEQVFNALKEKESIEAQLREETDKLQEEQNAKRSEIAELQNKLDLLPPASKAQKDAQEELQMKALELQVWNQFQQARLQREQAVQLENVYRKTLDTIGRVATENGYDLVLFKESAPDFKNVNPQQIATVLQLRKVLWSKEEIDLTDQIITRMNNDFDAGR